MIDTLIRLGRVDEDRAEHVAQHVHAHDGEGAGAGGARRLDEIEGAHLVVHALGDARDRRDEDDGQRHDRVEMPAPSAPEIAMASSTEGKA